MSSQTAYRSCEICAASRGEYLCLQCDQLFCTRCKSSHLKAKISKNHVFFHGPNIKQKVITRCVEHDELFIYQCFKCNMPVCRVCFVKSHKSHNFADLTEYTDELKTKVRKKTESILESLENNNASVKDGTIKYQQEIQTVIQSIADEGTRQKQLIDMKVADIILAVKEEETHHLQTLSQIQNDIQRAHDKITECKQRLDSLTIGDISKSIIQVKSEVDMVNVPDLPVIPTVSYKPKVTTERDIDQLFSNVDTTNGVEVMGIATKGDPSRDLPKVPKVKISENSAEESNECLSVLKHMLAISARLPECVDRTNIKDGTVKFVHLPRVTTAKYKDQFNTLIEHVEMAQTYILQLNDEIIRLREEKINQSFEDVKQMNCYPRGIVEKKNRGFFGRIFADRSSRFSSDSDTSVVKELSKLNLELDQLKTSYSDQKIMLQNITKEKIVLQSRLNTITGDQLDPVGFPITDIGVPNRPMKIVEKYGELYDNEWTDNMDMIDDIKELFPDVERKEHEDIAIRYLHRILLECFHDCKNESQVQMRALGFSSSEDDTDQDQKSKRQSGTFKKEENFNLERRRNAESFSKYLCQEKRICKNLLANWGYPWKSEKLLEKLIATPYFQKCVTLCWYMVIQDPMMYLDEPLDKDSSFDRGSYKDFVQKGDRVEFVVWPALYLHKGGPLLYKGVVQAYTQETNKE